MDIRLTGSAPVTTTAAPQAPPREREIKPEAESVADIYSTSRSIGNYTSGIVLGAATETVTAAAQSPRLAWEIAENLWQTETLGPNIKVLGTLAALPAAALSLAAAPLYGAFQGGSRVHHAGHSRQDGPLTQDTSVDVAREMTTKTDGEARTMSGKLIASLEELGARKLDPGEKPFDVPLLSPAFALVGGAVSGTIGGAVGLVAGVVAGTITGAKDIYEGFTSPDLTFGQRAGKVLASPLNLMVGPVLAWKSIKEAVPRGLSDGWHHGLVKPLADTVRISGTLGKSVIQEAWEK